MNRDEMFKVFDAVNPSVEDIKAYLNKKCGKTPLVLAFKKEGLIIYSNDILKNAAFVGIVIKDTVFYSRGFGYEDMLDSNKKLLYPDLSVGDLQEWLRKNSSLFGSKGRFLTESDYNLINDNSNAFCETLSILEYHGLKMPRFAHGFCFIGGNPKMVYGKTTWGETRLHSFIQKGSDCWICSPK